MGFFLKLLCRVGIRWCAIEIGTSGVLQKRYLGDGAGSDAECQQSDNMECENCIRMGKKSIKALCQCTRACALGPAQSVTDWLLFVAVYSEANRIYEFLGDFKHQRL